MLTCSLIVIYYFFFETPCCRSDWPGLYLLLSANRVDFGVLFFFLINYPILLPPPLQRHPPSAPLILRGSSAEVTSLNSRSTLMLGEGVCQFSSVQFGKLKLLTEPNRSETLVLICWFDFYLFLLLQEFCKLFNAEVPCQKEVEDVGGG